MCPPVKFTFSILYLYFSVVPSKTGRGTSSMALRKVCVNWMNFKEDMKLPLEQRSKDSTKLHQRFRKLSKAWISIGIEGKISCQFGDVLIESQDVIIALNSVEKIFAFVHK